MVALACSGLFLAGCASRPVINGVPNFAQVAPGIYRGGQPSEDGWRFLRSLGVTNVVKLNREIVDPPADGLKTHFIPLPPAVPLETFQQPGSNDVWRAVQAMNQGGTYVHCLRGRDRTGVVVGCYRMWIEGWSKPAAEREMDEMGFRWSIPGLSAFWKSTPEKRAEENK
jgi:hypothetical protein